MLRCWAKTVQMGGIWWKTDIAILSSILKLWGGKKIFFLFFFFFSKNFRIAVQN